MQKITGTVTRVLPLRGYGFVLGDDGREYFMHARRLAEGQLWGGPDIREGSRVEFTPTTDSEGGQNKLRAADLRTL